MGTDGGPLVATSKRIILELPADDLVADLLTPKAKREIAVPTVDGTVDVPQPMLRATWIPAVFTEPVVQLDITGRRRITLKEYAKEAMLRTQLHNIDRVLDDRESARYWQETSEGCPDYDPADQDDMDDRLEAGDPLHRHRYTPELIGMLGDGHGFVARTGRYVRRTKAQQVCQAIGCDEPIDGTTRGGREFCDGYDCKRNRRKYIRRGEPHRKPKPPSKWAAYGPGSRKYYEDTIRSKPRRVHTGRKYTSALSSGLPGYLGKGKASTKGVRAGTFQAAPGYPGVRCCECWSERKYYGPAAEYQAVTEYFNAVRTVSFAAMNRREVLAPSSLACCLVT